jgi:UDP-N-acetylglucosamine 2-epimerase (non-hydrolysing)
MIAFVVGTRPELIKIAPVVDALVRRKAPLAIVHTGQHYSYQMDAVFFEELGLPPPFANLEVGSAPAALQLGTIIIRAAEALAKVRPDWVLVQGDTNSVLGGALAAYKLGIPIAHLEAGLRSDDWEMPEEANRVLAGRIAALHLCPTETQRERLKLEGIVRGVEVVGNTVVDAALKSAERSRQRSTVVERLGLTGQPYGLVTLHRPSNVDSDDRLRTIMRELLAIADKHSLRLVFPIHPRTRATIARMEGGARFFESPFVTTEPAGYMDFLRLLADAKLVLTDSGGVQEEACTLRVPCVTIRANTERPETVDVGANMLCDLTSPGQLEATVATMLARPRTWKNPFGDGQAGERVAALLLDPGVRRVPSGAP